jgi:hypothetical protein
MSGAARSGFPRGVIASALAVVALAAALPAAGQERGGLALGARAATTGFGAELAFPLGARVAGRLAATGASYDLEFDTEQVTYEGTAELASVLAVADLHPSGGGFRVSLGALIHDNSLTGHAPVRDLLLEEGIRLPPGIELGQLRARATVDPVAPYLGIGWGASPRSRPGFHLSIDLGAAWHGEPDVDLTLSTPVPVALVPGGQAFINRLLADEERALEAELSDYTVFPVAALSLSYRF